MGAVIQHYTNWDLTLILWTIILLLIVIGPAISTVMQKGHPFESLATTFGITLGTEAVLVTITAIVAMMAKEISEATASTAEGITITIPSEVLECMGPILIGLAIAGIFIFLVKNDY